MSMTVTPNADGSYTVRCGNDEVTVGRSGAPMPAPEEPSAEPGSDNDEWPEDPEGNDGGVVAYLHVGPPPRRRFPADLPGSDPLTPPLEWLARPILRYMPDATTALRFLDREVVEVTLGVPPGQVFDLTELLANARRIRRETQVRAVQLHVYLEGGSPTSIGLPTQVELP